MKHLTKEEYLNFVAAWKDAANHEHNKRHWIDRSQAYGGRYKSASWLTPTHYVLRNVMLDKPIDRGFSPKGKDDWTTLNESISRLQFIIKRASSDSSYVDKFLEPFGGKITKEDLVKLETVLEEAKKAA